MGDTVSASRDCSMQWNIETDSLVFGWRTDITSRPLVVYGVQ